MLKWLLPNEISRNTNFVENNCFIELLYVFCTSWIYDERWINKRQTDRHSECDDWNIEIIYLWISYSNSSSWKWFMIRIDKHHFQMENWKVSNIEHGTASVTSIDLTIFKKVNNPLNISKTRNDMHRLKRC